MATLTIIAGPSSSGKSSLAQKMIDLAAHTPVLLEEDHLGARALHLLDSGRDVILTLTTDAHVEVINLKYKEEETE